jgi:protease I
MYWRAAFDGAADGTQEDHERRRTMARIAMPVAEGFEDSEFTVSYDRLSEAGHHITVFGPKAGEVVAGKRGQATARIETTAQKLDPGSFDALVIPGGHAPDKLRLDRNVVEFVRRFAETGKTIAAVCHGPQLLIEADLVKGRTMTSWPSVRKDLENAGAHWRDKPVIEDGNLITSRKPADLDAFCAKILEHLSSDAAAAAAG